jgi:hypothetical protein
MGQKIGIMAAVLAVLLAVVTISSHRHVGSERKELIKINPPSRPGHLPPGIQHFL